MATSLRWAPPPSPHELFEDGPRTGAVYKAGFAALTAPDVMAGAAGGPVARALPPPAPTAPVWEVEVLRTQFLKST